MSRHSAFQAARCSSRSAPRLRNGTPRAAYSSACQLTVGCTTSLPSDRRSSAASWCASRMGCRSGAMIAPATTRSRVVAAAMALIRTMLSGHGVAGILVARRGVGARVLGRPAAPALGPRTRWSLSMTASTPASSASCAMRTSARRSRGGTSVWFSVRTRMSRGAAMDEAVRAAGGRPAIC